MTFVKYPIIFSIVFGMLFLADLLQATPPDWGAIPGHQNAMVIYASVVNASGQPLVTPGSLLAASEYGVLAGVTPLSAGPNGPIYQMKIGSDRWEADLTYRFYDAMSGKDLEVDGGPEFLASSIVGSITDPVILKVKQ
jgi:hypothetical protein